LSLALSPTRSYVRCGPQNSESAILSVSYEKTLKLMFALDIRIVIPNIQGRMLVMIPRKEYRDWITRALGRSPIVALLGPRQCGKTTLARLLCDQRRSTYMAQGPSDRASPLKPETSIRITQDQKDFTTCKSKPSSQAKVALCSKFACGIESADGRPAPSGRCHAQRAMTASRAQAGCQDNAAAFHVFLLIFPPIRRKRHLRFIATNTIKAPTETFQRKLPY